MESNEDLRAELKAAIANVTRQMENQDNSYPLKGVGAGESNARLVAELAAERAQLEEALEGLGQETEKGDDRAAAVPEEVESEPSGGGVLTAMRGRQVEPRVLGRVLLVVGTVGLLVTVLLAVARFVFGVVITDRAGNVPAASDIAGILAVLGAAFAGALTLGIAVQRGVSRDSAGDDLVR